jgi:hypothetical protein
MTSPNGIDAAIPNTAIQPKFDVSAMATFWMSNAARVMRSSEIFMRGIGEVTRLEAELGQQYWQRSLGELQMQALVTKPDQLARTRIDQTMQDVESLIVTMRKIADEFRHAINESTQALLDVPRPEQEQSLVASIHIDDPVIRRKPAQSAPVHGATG